MQEQPDNLPERVIKDLKNNTQSFVMIFFNKDGFPMLNIHAPSIKDFLALERMLMDYGAGLPLDERDGFIKPEDEEDGDGDGTESWKNND